MPCGRIDKRFPRRHFPRRDTSLSSTRFPWVHRTDKVCARTFWSLDLPLRFLPFQCRLTSRPTTENQCEFWCSAACCSISNECEGGSPSLQVAQCGGYVIWANCMLVSKHPVALTYCFPGFMWPARRVRTGRMSIGG